MKVCFLYFSGSDTDFTFIFEKITYGVLVTMENTEYHTFLALRENIDFDEKVDIEDLVLPSEKTSTPNMENNDIKEEPMDPEFSSAQSSQSVLSSYHSENEHFHHEIEKDIGKLFEELDMMSRYKYDQMRVRKVMQLVEKYQRIDPKEQVSIERLEKNLEAKTTELNKLREEFKKTQHEFDMKSNQMNIENNELKKKVIEITEERKVAMSLNYKTMNGIIKMHEKALADKSDEIIKLKKEILSTRHEFDIKSNQMSPENSSLKKKVKEITEEHALSQNSKTTHSIVKMHEKALEDKTNKLNEVKGGLQVAETNNLTFSKKIQKLELATNQVSNKNQDFKPNLKSFDKKKMLENRDKELFECPSCKKTLGNKKSFDAHVKNKHETKKFQCDDCGKKFGRKDYLKSHVLQHSDEKLFACKNCPKKFKHESSLASHIKSRLNKSCSNQNKE